MSLSDPPSPWNDTAASDIFIVVFSVESIVGAVLLAVGVSLFIRDSGQFPISGRLWPAVVLMSCSSQIQVFIEGIGHMFQQNCSWVRVVNHALNMITLSGLCVRVYRVWFAYFAAKEKAVLFAYKRLSAGSRCESLQGNHVLYKQPDMAYPVSGDGDGDGNEQSPGGHSHRKLHSNASSFQSARPTRVTLWFMQRRTFGTDSFLLKLYFGIAAALVTFLCISFAVINFNTGAGPQSEDCLSLTVSFYYLLVWSGIVVLVLAVTAWKIRNIRDGFHIKTELKCVLLFAILVIGIAQLNVGLQVMIQWLPTQGSLVASLYYPVYLAYKQRRLLSRQRATRSVSVSSETPLLEVLVDESHQNEKESFRDHLVAEFNVENIIFWEEVRLFEEKEDDMTDDECARAALKLYQNFLSGNAPLEVNLPFVVSAEIEKQLENDIENFHEFRNKSNIFNEEDGLFGPFNVGSPQLAAAKQPGGDAEEESSKGEGGNGEDAGPAINLSPLDVDAKSDVSIAASRSRTRSRNAPSTRGGPEPIINQRPSKYLFKRAAGCIYKLMETDPFVRWKAQERRKQEEMEQQVERDERHGIVRGSFGRRDSSTRSSRANSGAAARGTVASTGTGADTGARQRDSHPHTQQTRGTHAASSKNNERDRLVYV